MVNLFMCSHIPLKHRDEVVPDMTLRKMKNQERLRKMKKVGEKEIICQ
jgi:hypothetical protein